MTDHLPSAAAPRSSPVQPAVPAVEDGATSTPVDGLVAGSQVSSPDARSRPSAPALTGAPAPEETPARRSVWKLIVTVIMLAALSGLFLFFPIDWDKIGRWGYVGVFLVVFIATASVALPIPYLFVVARASFFLDPLGVTLVAGLAGALGELSGYILGASGRELIPQNKVFDRARTLMVKYGFWCVAFFAFVPNPVFDAIGFAAGVLKYSVWRFLLACFIGKCLKFAMAAFAPFLIRHTCHWLPEACNWLPRGPISLLQLFGG